MLMLPKVLTHDEVEDTLRLFRETLRQGLSQTVRLGETVESPLLIIDGSTLEQFDSSALAVLLACRRMAQANQRGFLVQALPPKLAALAQLYGVDALLPTA
jgi:phospholipid transport system transporter-binding protein